jgi:hypothetical protein
MSASRTGDRVQSSDLLRESAVSAGPRIRLLLAVASFIIYATVVLVLHQDRSNQFLAEREAFAVAVSSALYHAPLGTAYSGVSIAVRDLNTPLETALEQATKEGRVRGTLTYDGGMEGNGVGYLVLATAAMLVFGVHTYSPILMMLGLMGISGAAFLARFGAGIAVVVMLYFFALTLLLFSSQVWDPQTALNIPIGGIRYLAVLGILPAFHLAAELVDLAPPGPVIRRWRLCLLAAQVVILVLGVLTRTSGASLLAATGFIWLLTLWKNRRDRSHIWRQVGNGAVIGGATCAVVTFILLLLPPNYLGTGRLTGQVWHRTFVGLGLNPEWPFGNLREVYNCDYAEVPGLRLEPGLLDANGGCIWIHYAHAHNIQVYPVEPAALEAAEREAYFNIVRLYPRQVLATYLYYKPRMLAAEIKNAVVLPLRLHAHSPLLKVLLVAALINFLAFVVTPSDAPDASWNRRLGGMALLFALCNIPGYFLAWPGTAQTIDLRVYVVFIAGLALNALAESIIRLRSAGAPAEMRQPSGS